MMMVFLHPEQTGNANAQRKASQYEDERIEK